MAEATLTGDELRDSLREFLAAHSALSGAAAERHTAHGVPPELWREMAALGWLGIATPERFGGMGLGLPALSILYQELGRYLNPLPVMSTQLAVHAINLAGNEAQRQAWLPTLASGAGAASLALPCDGQPLARCEHGAISGSIDHVLFGDVVANLLVPVSCGADQLCLAMVPRTDPTVLIEPRASIDLTRSLATVRLHGTPIPREGLLPLDAASWSALLNHACLAVACDSFAGASHIFERTVAYLGTRRQFGRPIGAFQALKHRAASWKILLEGVQAMTEQAASLLASGAPDCSAGASIAKFSACDAYTAIAGDALQLHGGIGFTWEHECHRFLKRATLNAALFGNSSQHRDRVAECAFASALGAPNPRRRLLAALPIASTES